MKGIEYILIVAGILAVWYLTSTTREIFVPELLDQTDVKRTAERSSSSYEQRTNHAIPTPYDKDPIPGAQSPFRVNMFNSYIL
jgi:hypothetical protein